MSGKGDKPRPVNKDVFDENYEKIFGPWITLSKRGKKRAKKRTRKKKK